MSLQCRYCSREWGDKTSDAWLIKRIGSCVGCRDMASRNIKRLEAEARRKEAKEERHKEKYG